MTKVDFWAKFGFHGRPFEAHATRVGKGLQVRIVDKGDKKYADTQNFSDTTDPHRPGYDKIEDLTAVAIETFKNNHDASKLEPEK